MNLKTKEITLDDFKAWSGIDLADEMQSTEEAQALLERVTYRLETYVDACFYKNVRVLYGGLNDYQKEHYKHALLEQLLFVFRNGDLSVSADRHCVSVAPNAQRELVLAGVWNGQITGWRGFGDVWH